MVLVCSWWKEIISPSDRPPATSLGIISSFSNFCTWQETARRLGRSQDGNELRSFIALYDTPATMKYMYSTERLAEWMEYEELLDIKERESPSVLLLLLYVTYKRRRRRRVGIGIRFHCCCLDSRLSYSCVFYGLHMHLSCIIRSGFFFILHRCVYRLFPGMPVGPKDSLINPTDPPFITDSLAALSFLILKMVWKKWTTLMKVEHIYRG